MSDGCLKQSVNKSAFELLNLPIPGHIKDKAKTFIDVFVDSIATGLSGLLLLLVVRQMELPVAAVSAMIAILVAVWLLLIKGVHGTYIASFQQQIRLKSKPANALPDPELSRRLKNVSSDAPIEPVMNLLRKLKHTQSSDLLEGVKRLLDHRSEFVRAEALRHLTEYDEDSDQLTNRVQRMLFDKSTTVKIEALSYLIEHAPELRDGLLEDHLDDPDRHLRGAALVALAKLSVKSKDLSEAFQLIERVEEGIAEVPFFRTDARRSFHEIILIHAIGYGRIREYYPWLEAQLRVAKKTVRRQTITAAAATRDERFLPRFVALLDQPDYRKRASRAIAKYGAVALPHLDALLRSEHGPDLLPGVVGAYARIPDPVSLQRLEALRERADQKLRRQLVRELGTLRRLAPDLPYHEYDYSPWLRGEREYFLLLLRARAALRRARKNNTNQRLLGRTREVSRLRKRILDELFNERRRSLNRMFILLNLHYPHTDLLALYPSLTHEKLSIRGSTIEVLDNTLSAEHKSLFIPLFEAVALVRKPDAVLQFLHLRPLSERAALEKLAQQDRLELAQDASSLLDKISGDAKIVELRA